MLINGAFRFFRPKYHQGTGSSPFVLLSRSHFYWQRLWCKNGPRVFLPNERTKSARCFYHLHVYLCDKLWEIKQSTVSIHSIWGAPRRVSLISISVGLILMLWHGKTHINPLRNKWIVVDPVEIELANSRLRQHCQLPVFQQVDVMSLKLF